MTTFRTAYEETSRITTDPVGESRTKQCFNGECDINSIMRKYERSGLIEHANEHQGDYGDFTRCQDYQASMNQVLKANEMFESLPARVRARFENDAGQFLTFCENPENLPEMVELGLAKRRVEPVIEEKIVPEKEATLG